MAHAAGTEHRVVYLSVKRQFVALSLEFGVAEEVGREGKVYTAGLVGRKFHGEHVVGIVADVFARVSDGVVAVLLH